MYVSCIRKLGREQPQDEKELFRIKESYYPLFQAITRV